MSHRASPSDDLIAMLHCQFPIMLAGMNVAAGPVLAAAVCNAGGVGVIGGLGATPAHLRRQIEELKEHLDNDHRDAPFGVDLLLPKVGEGARKTNYSYVGGDEELQQLLEEVVRGGAKLFVCAVGVPPKFAVEYLHAHGVLVMNMIGAPKHVPKALEAGVDLICAQGGEGGGHTGDVSTLVLIPACLDILRDRQAKSPLTGKPVLLVAAGGIGRGTQMAAALVMGAAGVWVGTRFICANEAGAHPMHQQEVLTAGYEDTQRTLAFTGRPLRVKKNKFVLQWENERRSEKEDLLARGIIPYKHEEDRLRAAGDRDGLREAIHARRLLMGQVAGQIDSIKPAREIVEQMVRECRDSLHQASSTRFAKL